LNNSSIILDKNLNNTTKQLSLTIEPSGAKNNLVTWSSSDTKVATVDKNGKVTAKKVGSCKISATIDGFTVECTVIVKEGTTNLTISTTSITLNAPIKKTYQLTAIKTPANSTDDIVWSSSNNDIATVDKNGKINARSTGTAKITAKSGTKSAACSVIVNDASMYTSYYYSLDTKNISKTKPSRNHMGFWVYIPNVSLVQDVEKLPLIVFLHGLGECSSNLNTVYNVRHGIPYYLRTGNNYPAIFIIPQLYNTSDSWESKHKYVKGIIDYAIANYNVDTNKIALTGFSLGGSGVWQIALKYPNLFSCLVPVSGYSKELLLFILIVQFGYSVQQMMVVNPLQLKYIIF